MRRTFEYRVSFYDALDWQLHKTSLRWELIDRAEQAAEQQHPGFLELSAVEVKELNVRDDEFVVRFEWDDEG